MSEGLRVFVVLSLVTLAFMGGGIQAGANTVGRACVNGDTITVNEKVYRARCALEHGLQP